MKEIGNLYDTGYKFIVTPGFKFETAIFNAQTIPIKIIFQIFAFLLLNIVLNGPEKIVKIIEKNGKFCTKAIYFPSFFKIVEISSRSNVP